MTKDRVGFVGVGLMGHGMAKNIVEKGFPLTVIAHRNREPVEDLKQRGAKEVSSLRELAENSDIVVLCVTGSPQVEATLTGPEGLASAGKKLIVCDCSTADPSSTLKLAELLAPQGITLVDAPLSRTPKDAEAGTLDVMAGGDDAIFERVRPVLETFAGRIVRTGPVGSGHTMKLLNNFVSLGYAALYSEALTLGAKAGLTPQVFDSVIRDGRMDCPLLPDLLHLGSGARPERPSLLDRQCAEGSDLSVGLGQRVRNSQSARRGGAQFLCAGGRRRRGGGLRAHAFRCDRQDEWREARGLEDTLLFFASASPICDPLIFRPIDPEARGSRVC